MKAKSLLLPIGVLALVLAGVSCDKGADPSSNISDPIDTATGGNGGDTDPTDRIKPVVAIQSPGNDTTVAYDSAYIAVQARVTDDGTIASVTMRGASSVAAKETVKGSRVYVARVPIGVAVNSIIVTAVDGGSNVGSDTVLVTRPLDPPVFDPDTGIYTAPVSVTMKNSTTGSSIYYTLNTGKDPVPGANGTLQYTGTAIPVTRSTVIKARSVLAGVPTSQTSTGSYTITGTVATPVLSIDTATFTRPVKIAITCATQDAVIRYTTDGADPTETNSRVYQDSILVQSTTVIKAKAFKGNWDPSNTDSAVVRMLCAAPRISKPTGIYETPMMIGVSSATPGSVIYYTKDGSLPVVTSDGTVTRGTRLNDGDSISVDSNVTLTAIATRIGWTSSAPTTAAYTYQVAKPTFSPDTTTSFRASVSVGIRTTTSGAVVRYTTDGTDPTTASSSLDSTSTLKFTEITRLKARAYKDGWTPSAIEDKVYYVIGDTLLVEDFEANDQGVTRIGTDLFAFSCASGCKASPSLRDGISNTLSPAVGTRSGRVEYILVPTGPVKDAVPDVAGWAGIGVWTPSKLMGTSGNLMFWAKFVPEAGSAETKWPLVVEVMTKDLNNDNTGYQDAFWRQVIEITTEWQQYTVDLGALYYPVWAIRKMPSKCTIEGVETPAVIAPLDVARFAAMGLPAFATPSERWEGPVDHNCPVSEWVHRVDRDKSIDKSTITGFRWSLIGKSGKGEFHLDHIKLWQQRPSISGN